VVAAWGIDQVGWKAAPRIRHRVFASVNNGIFGAREDGTIQPQAPIESKTNLLIPQAFTPDGRRLAYARGAGTAQILTVPTAQPRAPPPQHLPRAVIPRRSHDAASGVRSRSAQIQPAISVRKRAQPATGLMRI